MQLAVQLAVLNASSEHRESAGVYTSNTGVLERDRLGLAG